MMMFRSLILGVTICLLISSCGGEDTPSRDQIPIIKERITKLQDGVLAKNRAAIDSLLSVDILKKKQSSDSLINLVYGPGHEMQFESFGRAEIVYTDNFAKVESSLNYTSDSTAVPITFTFSNEGGQWLLIDFKSGNTDSTK